MCFIMFISNIWGYTRGMDASRNLSERLIPQYVYEAIHLLMIFNFWAIAALNGPAWFHIQVAQLLYSGLSSRSFLPTGIGLVSKLLQILLSFINQIE